MTATNSHTRNATPTMTKTSFMRWIIAFQVLCVSAFAQTLTVSSPQAFTPSANYQTNWGSQHSFPSGKVLGFYRSGSTHINSHGVIMQRVSSQARLQSNAQDWDAGTVLYDPPNQAHDARHAVVVTRPDGSLDLLILVMNYSLVQVGDYHNTWTLSKHSDDEGVTWSAPQIVSKSGSCVWDGQASAPTGDCFYGYSYGVSSSPVSGTACINALEFNQTAAYYSNLKTYLLCDSGSGWNQWVHIKTPSGNFGYGWVLDSAELSMVKKGDRYIGVMRAGYNSQWSKYGGSLFFFSSDTVSDHWPNLTWSIVNQINLPTAPVPGYWASQGYGYWTSPDFDYSPWILDPNSPDGNLILFVPERLTLYNGTMTKLVTSMRAVIFSPAAVIAQPNGGFPAFQTLDQQVLNLGSADYGYPSAMLLDNGGIYLQYHDEPRDVNGNPTAQRAQLYSMKLRIECGDSSCQPNGYVPPPPPPVCTLFQERYMESPDRKEICVRDSSGSLGWRSFSLQP